MESKDDSTLLQRNLRHLLEKRGRSAREVSLAVTGTNDSLVKAILDGRSKNPRQDTLKKLADYFGVNVSNLTESDLAAAHVNQPLTGTTESGGQEPFITNEVRRLEGVGGPPDTTQWPRDVEILGTAVGGDGGEFYFNGDNAGWAKRPPVLFGVKQAFAIYLSNDSMRPVFKPGKVVYINPGRPAAPGDYVLVELHAESGDRNGPAFLKQLVRRTARELHLRQLNPPRDLPPIPMSRVKNIYRALEPDEWLGD